MTDTEITHWLRFLAFWAGCQTHFSLRPHTTQFDTKWVRQENHWVIAYKMKGWMYQWVNECLNCPPPPFFFFKLLAKQTKTHHGVEFS